MQNFVEIVTLSISVSIAATVVATAISLPVGAALAIFPFRGRRSIVVLINAFFGLPPVVVGLVLYLALSRSGPLGSLALLFTPAAMVIAQTILAIPIITALVHRASERAWARYGDELISDGATRLQAVPQILMIIRADIVTAVLAGFGRTVSEVGAVILVGGNIRGLTRTMTTTIALQTSQGDLSLALALGAVLVGISISISATVFALAGRARTAGVTKYDESSIYISTSCDRRRDWCLFGGRAIHRSGLDDFGRSVRAIGEHPSPIHGQDWHHGQRGRAGDGQGVGHRAPGDADLLLVHDPEAEQQFMDEGHGSTRRQIAWNDFIIVGPSTDPAHVHGGSDSVSALKAIALAHAPFVSRGDKSGTNAAELRLWKIAGQTPDALNKEKWYRDIGGGMGQALYAASAMDAYTLSDRGTWLSFNNKGSLVIAVEGDPRLINRYDVIELNPQKHAGTKLTVAKVFADWLVSSEGQHVIGAYQVNGQKLFNPSAGSPK